MHAETNVVKIATLHSYCCFNLS